MNELITSKIKKLADIRKSKMTQQEMSELTGISRSNIANFEAGRVNNMYLYDLYLTMFSSEGDT